ncbi:MAG: hypothetical protein EXQ96_08115 [Alphaproteobacteria bacterium]|nr:hypothetical protein [Alphaproteobacteria bacterium]
MLVITVIATAAFFSLPGEFEAVAAYGLWSAALLPNVGFWTDTSYFEDTIYRPFLHFWSLGVELH